MRRGSAYKKPLPECAGRGRSVCDYSHSMVPVGLGVRS